jgi:hypothetical protein
MMAEFQRLISEVRDPKNDGLDLKMAADRADKWLESHFGEDQRAAAAAMLDNEEPKDAPDDHDVTDETEHCDGCQGGRG